MEGSTVTAEHILTVGEFAEQEAMNITQEIFDLAVDYKQAKRAIIVIKIDKSGAKDEYGHEQSGVVQLSNPVTVDDLDEVRKYKDWKTYFNKSGIGHWLPMQIKSSSAGHLLKSLR